jgi:hypothetical protein
MCAVAAPDDVTHPTAPSAQARRAQASCTAAGRTDAAVARKRGQVSRGADQGADPGVVPPLEDDLLSLLRQQSPRALTRTAYLTNLAANCSACGSWLAFRGPKAAPASCAALALAPPAASPASACPRPGALALRVSLLPLQCRRCCRCCSKCCMLSQMRLLLPPPPLSLPLRRGGCSRGGYHCLQAAQCRRRPPCRCGHAFLSEQRCCCCCVAAAAAEEAPCSVAQQPRQQLAAAGACRRPAGWSLAPCPRCCRCDRAH